LRSPSFATVSVWSHRISILRICRQLQSWTFLSNRIFSFSFSFRFPQENLVYIRAERLIPFVRGACRSFHFNENLSMMVTSKKISTIHLSVIDLYRPYQSTSRKWLRSQLSNRFIRYSQNFYDLLSCLVSVQSTKSEYRQLFWFRSRCGWKMILHSICLTNEDLDFGFLNFC